MPKIKVTTEIIDLAGNPIVSPPKNPGEKPEPLTLRAASIQALMGADDKATGDQKFKVFMLAQRIHEEDEPTLKSEEITLVKNAVGKLFFPLVVGRVWNLLDPPPMEEE